MVFRTKTGDGYDLQLFKGLFGEYEEFKHGVVDGLYINQETAGEHWRWWERRSNGKLAGKTLRWNSSGMLVFEAEFKEPVTFSNAFQVPIGATWEKAPPPPTNK